MPTLVPDRSRRIFFEEDVTPPAGTQANDAYDLALYHEMNRPGRAVLIVRTQLQFQFNDGTSTRPENRGQPLRWTQPEKRGFANDAVAAIMDVWNDRFRITTTSRVPAATDVGVQFEIGTYIDGWHLDDHWEVAVERADDFRVSSVNSMTGNCSLDSQDIIAVQKTIGAQRQRGMVHEFGHMLAFLDEYPAASRRAAAWSGDVNSIMHSGETLRERHYAMFAHWITEQFIHVGHLARERIEFKVAGRVDLAAAQLGRL